MEGAQFAGFSLDTSTGFLSHWTAVGRISAGENHKSYHKSNSTPLHQSCPEWQMVQVCITYLIRTHSLVSCRGPCSAAVCSTDTGSDGVYWWYILQTRGTCTPDSSWCCAWRNPYSPHSSLLHNDDLNTHTHNDQQDECNYLHASLSNNSLQTIWGLHKYVCVMYLRPYLHKLHNTPLEAS